jgi:hypothetical protein
MTTVPTLTESQFFVLRLLLQLHGNGWVAKETLRRNLRDEYFRREDEQDGDVELPGEAHDQLGQILHRLTAAGLLMTQGHGRTREWQAGPMTDLLREQGYLDGDVSPPLRKTRRTDEKAAEFVEALHIAKLWEVTLMSADREISLKEQARLARELFRRLYIPHLRVRVATGSMCYWVHVKYPCHCNGPADDVTSKLHEILEHAFPGFTGNERGSNRWHIHAY